MSDKIEKLEDKKTNNKSHLSELLEAEPNVQIIDVPLDSLGIELPLKGEKSIETAHSGLVISNRRAKKVARYSKRKFESYIKKLRRQNIIGKNFGRSAILYKIFEVQSKNRKFVRMENPIEIEIPNNINIIL